MTADRKTASMIRVDQAGEYGATRIYAGQLAVLGNRGPHAQEILHMAEQEAGHRARGQRARVRAFALAVAIFLTPPPPSTIAAIASARGIRWRMSPFGVPASNGPNRVASTRASSSSQLSRSGAQPSSVSRFIGSTIASVSGVGWVGSGG